jgi:hypothetical protein
MEYEDEPEILKISKLLFNELEWLYLLKIEIIKRSFWDLFI